MIIKESTVTKLTVTDVPHLDPINVFFEDYGPRQGKVNIEVHGDSWSYFWGAMGEGYSIKSFFLKADTGYLAKKLKIGIPTTVDDDSQEALQLAAKREIIKSRRWFLWSKESARDKWDLINSISSYGKEENEDILYEIFGDEWYNWLPQKPNPRYQYLCRIIEVIKSAIRIPSDFV